MLRPTNLIDLADKVNEFYQWPCLKVGNHFKFYLFTRLLLQMYMYYFENGGFDFEHRKNIIPSQFKFN